MKCRKTAEDGLKSKNARKQIHSKIQFYIGIHVTKVEKNIFLKSPCPNPQATREKSAPNHLGKLLHTPPYGQCPYEINTFQKGASLTDS